LVWAGEVLDDLPGAAGYMKKRNQESGARSRLGLVKVRRKKEEGRTSET
jgi:hypothetical protein